ncbi:hypothetical protein [Macrococcus bovicus]|uniref:hypothetical protein n=1 Tax=Macrococcus bovicus TaxID=69968 RepID=UPI0025A55EF2|nr:hypothetical protein [Macrococcus bovicus]WJP97368.1 hypothetical protein QSV55_08830 [Macrococcus bovicus]
MMTASMQELEKNKKETSIKSMYFNRYLGVRYTLALFFFCNLYWLLSSALSSSMSLLLPAVNIVLAVLAMYEQVRIFSSHTSDAPAARRAFRVIGAVNVLVITLLFIPGMFEWCYPFINATMTNRLIVAAVLLAGLLLTLYTLQKLTRIRQQHDKQYHRIKQYEKLI